MKDSFLVHITLPDVFNQKFYDLIPEQRKVINDLLEKRIVLSYSLDMERKNVWAFIEADNEHAVMDILSTFPIIKYVQVNIHELAFHNPAPITLPDLIMN
jgi:muconolactone delta-isomerase